MNKRFYRFFGGLLSAQEAWLNNMARQGWRLVRTGKLLYEFEACPPGQMAYKVEFIAQKSREAAEDYRVFLEDLGYQVFYKNINLSYSIGKVKWRPWAERGGRLATQTSTLHRELLIVGREAAGQPFLLHTSLEDRARYYAVLRRPWLFTALLFGLSGAVTHSLPFGGLALAALLPALIYQSQIVRIRREGEIRE